MKEVLFSCVACGTVRAKCFMRDRRAGETLESWLDELGWQMKLFHSLNSPMCTSLDMSDVMIPVPDDKRGVGF